jgi:serine/threonine-protein kinase
LIILGLAGMGGGVFYARRNLRLGRGDRRGAVRIMLVVLSLGMAAWVLSEHHVATPWEFALFITALSTALFFTGLIGVFYIALEPFVRRRWPQVLVSWTRIVLGSWRDPLVGRDLLVGCATGIAVVCLIRLETNVASWFAYPGGSLFTPGIDNVLGPLAFVNALLKNLAAGVIFQGLQGLFLLFFLRMLLRNDWAAAVVWVVARTLMSSNRFATGEAIVIAGPLAVALAMGVIQNLLLFLVLKRLGFVAFMAALLVMSVFASFPMTFQASAWYAGYGYAALAIVAAIAIYGFRTSLGGRPLLVGAGVDD